MAEEFSLTAKLLGDGSGLAHSLESAQSMLKGYGLDLEKMTAEGGDLFKKFGVDIDAFAGKFGVSAPLLVGVAAAGVALFEVGQEVFEVGMKFDESFSTIGKATGAVGPQLRELSDGFVKVMGSGVVQGIDDLAQAFALLAQKLDVTGDELQKLTTDFSAFADVNRTSVTESVRTVTALMQQWNIETADATMLMDQLTRAAQITGQPVVQLSDAVNASAAQFKQLGFSLTESIGFLTALSKVGVDVNMTTRALNTAVIKLGEDGRDAGEGFRELVAEIRAGADPQQILNDATLAFGDKAAPKMISALQNAKFDLEGFTAAIAEAGGTVEKTNEATESLGDKWAAFGNKAMAAVEPLGEVMIGIGKILMDVGNAIFEILNNILSPALDLIRDEFRDLGDIVKAVFGTVGALIRGDWKTAWVEAQLIVLNVVKAVLDFFSAMANEIIGIINNMTNALRTTLEAVGVHISAIAKVSLAEVSGLNATIKALYSSLEKEGDKATKELGVQAKAREKIINDEAKTYDISIQDRIKGAKELQEAYQLQQRAERSLTALTLQTAAGSASAAKTFQENAGLISGTIETMVSGPFQALGAALVNGENLWESFSKAAVHSIGAVVKAFGDQMAAKAALDLAQAIAYSSNPFTVAAAPGYYAQAAIEAGAATAAYVAAGALSAFEKGTPYSTGGAAMLAEAGPELVMAPSVHNLSQGSVVLNAQDTLKAMGGKKGATINFNVGEVRRDSVGALMRQAEALSRKLAFGGVL